MKKKIVLLVVVAIATLIFMGMAIRHFLVASERPAELMTHQQRVAATTSLIELIGEDLTIIKKECGSYPDSLEELVGDGFCSKDCPQVDCLKLEDLKDGWGRPFDYFHDSERLTIRSRGHDGKAGGAGEDEDFTLSLPMKDEP